MIAENVKKVISQIPAENPFGEKITLVAATKTRTPEEINEAIAAGITDIGENKVQEFTAKYDFVRDATRHFIGHLQTNKVKYLIGKCDLLQSLDRIELAEEIEKRAARENWVCNALVEINIGSELSKSGFSLSEAEEAYSLLQKYPHIRLKGLMGMLPISDDSQVLRTLCLSVRKIYDKIRAKDENFSILSMGMSGDWKLCIECGSNMIRLGTALFGPRRLPAPQNE